MIFNGPKLKHAFSGSGGKMPEDKPQSLMDIFKAKAVSMKGPALCKQLSAAFEALTNQHTENGRAKDVQTHIALMSISKRVETFRENIYLGGAEAYAKMKEAKQYLGRIQKLGLDA